MRNRNPAIDRGRIVIDRKIVDSIVYSNSDWLHIWLDILLHTNWKCRSILIDNVPKIIHAGEQITSQVKISERTGVQRIKVGRILKGLKSEQQIEHQTNNRFTFIKVLNWFEYQFNEQQIEHLCNNCVTTLQQLRNTTNKDNEDIKDNKVSNNENKNSKDEFSEIKKKLGIPEKPIKGLTQEFQVEAIRIIKALDISNNRKSAYFKVLKDYPRTMVLSAYSFAVDYPTPDARDKMFFWKLNKIKNESNQKNY